MRVCAPTQLLFERTPRIESRLGAVSGFRSLCEKDRSQINDTHGHEVGDVVLRNTVERLQSRLRTEDLLGRWGGDELVLVLPDTDLTGAVTAADALRALIARTAVSVDGERIPITLSAGAAEWHDESVQELLRRADAALYEAKAAGRNRVRTGHVAGAI